MRKLELPETKRDILNQILSLPSSPFREHHIIATVKQILKNNGVPHFQDPIGNIIIGLSSPQEYRLLVQQKRDEPVKMFIAHMDHPGFHGVRWKSSRILEAKWFGGSPTNDLIGAEVWLANRSGWLESGTMIGAELTESRKSISKAEIEVSENFVKGLEPRSLYGGFGFRDHLWQEGDLIYTKAADDLVGAFAIISLAIDLWGKTSQRKTQKASSNRNAGVIGLLTRAEEVGFIGAIGHFQLGWLGRARRRDVLCVSLETSRALPGAEIGKGPVVRLGDRSTVFDAGSLKVFSKLADKVLPNSYQKRIMDGGTCEATASTAFGFSSVGISIPLGNYHNQSIEGGPRSRGPLGPAPEFVHLNDVCGMLELCHGLLIARQPWSHPWDDQKKIFLKQFRSSKKLLEQGL